MKNKVKIGIAISVFIIERCLESFADLKIYSQSLFGLNRLFDMYFVQYLDGGLLYWH